MEAPVVTWFGNALLWRPGHFPCYLTPQTTCIYIGESAPPSPTHYAEIIPLETPVIWNGVVEDIAPVPRGEHDWFRHAIKQHNAAASQTSSTESRYVLHTRYLLTPARQSPWPAQGKTIALPYNA